MCRSLGSSIWCCKLFYGATRFTLAVLFFYFGQQNVDTFLYFCRQTENTKLKRGLQHFVDKTDTFCGEIFHIYKTKKGVIHMTLQEVAQQLGKQESTIYKNFKRTQESLLKKGIILTRWGPDDYEIEYEEVDESFLEERDRQRRIERLRKELEELEGQGE